MTNEIEIALLDDLQTTFTSRGYKLASFSTDNVIRHYTYSKGKQIISININTSWSL